jgi:hypothetical protein
MASLQSTSGSSPVRPHPNLLGSIFPILLLLRPNIVILDSPIVIRCNSDLDY